MSFQMRSLMPSSMRSGATTTKQQGGLPVSQTHSKQQQQQEQEQEQQQQQGLRRRLSSLSLKIQPSPEAADATYSWVLRRSKSVSSMGEYAGSSIRKWWDWGCGWILSRKPTFARDLEMNEQETAVLGCHSKGSWRHVFYKLRKLLVRPHHNLPQTFRYDSVTYSQNFDDGIGKINTRSQLNH
ncbi:hypothetical protein ACSBR1_003549 [Camellia fascicularis]